MASQKDLEKLLAKQEIPSRLEPTDKQVDLINKLLDESTNYLGLFDACNDAEIELDDDQTRLADLTRAQASQLIAWLKENG